MREPRHLLLRTIGLAIRSRRRARGLSQESLAALAQLDRSYMSSVERGLRNISVLNLARIASALDVSVWELVGSREGASITPAARIRAEAASHASWTPGHYLSLG